MKRSVERKILNFESYIFDAFFHENLANDKKVNSLIKRKLIEKAKKDHALFISNYEKKIKILDSGDEFLRKLKVYLKFLDRKLIEVNYELDLANLMQPAKNGQTKPRTPARVSIAILSAIDECEIEKIDLEWLRDYLLPGSDLLEYSKKITRYQISIPSPSRQDQNNWLIKLKESLQRSLFSDNKVTKRQTELFKKKRDFFYSTIRTEDWKEQRSAYDIIIGLKNCK